VHQPALESAFVAIAVRHTATPAIEALEFVQDKVIRIPLPCCRLDATADPTVIRHLASSAQAAAF